MSVERCPVCGARRQAGAQRMPGVARRIESYRRGAPFHNSGDGLIRESPWLDPLELVQRPEHRTISDARRLEPASSCDCRAYADHSCLTIWQTDDVTRRLSFPSVLVPPRR